jgi:hypothetical protein
VLANDSVPLLLVVWANTGRTKKHRTHKRMLTAFRAGFLHRLFFVLICGCSI